MAHTARNKDDLRRFRTTFRPGDEVLLRWGSGFEKGRVNRLDEGNWVYVFWDNPLHGAPYFLRPEQLVRRTAEGTTT